MGKCVEKAHYRIRYLKSFRPLAAKEEIEFMEARPILYLNMAAVASLFNSRNQMPRPTAPTGQPSCPTSNRIRHSLD